MKQELDKLVELSLADGYISDKEREVLRRKAEKLGYDPDEIDIILDGKLYIKSNENKPKIRKCVSCGEVLTGISKVCPACDYVAETVTDEDEDDDEDDNDYVEGISWERDFRDLNELVSELLIAKKAPGDSIGNSLFRSVFTAGIYIPYMLFIKKQRPFDQYRTINRGYIAATNLKAEKLRRMYGANQELNAEIDSILQRRDAIIRSRYKNDYIRLAVLLVIWVAILWGIVAIANRPKSPETAEEKTERLISEQKIAAARVAFAGVTDPFKKEEYEASIIRMEIDSLVQAKEYDEALRMANLINQSSSYNIVSRADMIDGIVEQQVLELIEQKEYKKARERVKLADILKQDELEDKIKLAEELNIKSK